MQKEFAQWLKERNKYIVGAKFKLILKDDTIREPIKKNDIAVIDRVHGSDYGYDFTMKFTGRGYPDGLDFKKNEMEKYFEMI